MNSNPVLFLRSASSIFLISGILLVLGSSHGAPGSGPSAVKKTDVQIGEDSTRYIGQCKESYVRMIPLNSRKFWSYGYVYLNEPYPANCTMKYIYTIKQNPADTLAEYGFKIYGTFEGPNEPYDSCTDTDYVTINDTTGQVGTWCGTSADINFITGSNSLEFYFISQPNSVRARGFYVTIETYYSCGGILNSETHGPTGFISTPTISGLYPPETSCSWYFVSSEETTIKMDCSSFVLEDYVTFSNGTTYCPDYMNVTSEAITPGTTTTYCNSDMDTLARTIYSEGNSMLVKFSSDGQNHYSGFNCSYDFILYAV